MNKNKNAKEQPIPPTTYKFYLGSRERYIYISANFQSANIQLIRQMSEFNYRLNCIDDGVKTGHKVNSKSWFYFAVRGFTKNTRGKFTVSRVQTLMAVYHTAPKSYRPVCRQRMGTEGEWSEWMRIPTESPLVLRQTGQLEVIFDYLFKSEEHEVEFAFTFPYSYSKNLEYLNTLNQFYSHDDFYFHKEILVQSPQKRDVNLLTITSHDHPCMDPQQEELFNQKLFPEKCRPKRFKKPVILISGRVHPGQTAASYAMEGVIDFLVNTRDVRSYLLKKMFVFMVVPMINVDGVYHGHFRMDGYGKNLNRYYVDPSSQKQPAVFAIRELANHLIKSNRLSFYFDLHAHNAKKGHFIYGNAIHDFVEQVESQVFCKLFSLNHRGFQYEYCNFSQKQMNSKDKNEERTKEGCGRVVMHRMAHIIHSYSLQCGIISTVKNNVVPKPMNQDFQLGQKGLDENEQPETPFFTQNSYRELGKAMLVSILDVFDKNPYNRVYSSPQHKSLELLRRVTAFEVFHQAQRFRMFEKYVFGKVKNINELIREVLNSKLHYRQLYNFYFYNDHELKNTIWPENIPGLVKPKFTQKLRRFRSLNEPKMDYSLSFLNDLKTNRDQLDEEETGQERIEDEIQFQNDSRSSQTEDDQKELIEPLSESDFFQQMMGEDLQMHSQSLIPFDRPPAPAPEHEGQISRWNTDKTDQLWQTFASKELCQSEKDVMQEENLSCCIENNHAQTAEKVLRLKIAGREDDFDYHDIKLSSNESPSVRVRRLMRNQIPKKQTTKVKGTDIREKISEMISNSPQITHNSFVGGNQMNNYSGLSVKNEKERGDTPFHDKQMRLFEEIKLQIREQLRKHKDKTGIVCTSVKPKHKTAKYSMSEGKQKERIKSTNINFVNLNLNTFHSKQKSQHFNNSPSKTSIGKTQLPALNSHILIISSNSSKGLVFN